MLTSNAQYLSQIRALMKNHGIDAFLVGSEDAHQSEYVCGADMRRAFISGFTGSAGTALILNDSALLWTDGRYFLQAEGELSCDWTLMKSGERGVLELPEWVVKNMKPGEKFGFDSWLVTTTAANAMISKFQKFGIEVVPVQENLVDIIWTSNGKPEYPMNPIEVLGLDRCGVPYNAKITGIRKEMSDANTSAMLVTMLDEIAWLLNIRGSDVEFNPVVISYVVITDNDVCLFVDGLKITEEVRAHFGATVNIFPYLEVESYIQKLSQSGRIWLDFTKTNYRLYSAAGTSAVDKASPITLPKSIKNEAELNGFRAAHIRDGVALTAFLHWLEKFVQASPGTFSEYDVAVKIEEFRRKMDLHVGPSFSTIAGYGPHGAIIHYKPEKVTSYMLGVDSLFLLDSGAQYRDGTTDVTRTLHFGTPTEHMKTCYTAVLKGHIALASLIIPEGMLGSRIDCVARTALWKLGLDYNHGTGHGVGSYLNVHEGPQGIGYRKRENEVGFYSGMTISNEPGYYENGNFGIRIENICVTSYAETPFLFGGRKSLKFENLTMVPIKTDLINVDMMEDWEIEWLNSYHSTVRDNLSPLMKTTFPETMEYLVAHTEPLIRK